MPDYVISTLEEDGGRPQDRQADRQIDISSLKTILQNTIVINVVYGWRRNGAYAASLGAGIGPGISQAK